MAARNKAWTPAKVRERIQVSMLINRLHDHAFGKCEMTATQVKSACYLVSQAIGNPPSEISGPGGGPIEYKVTLALD
jgi:hypothetical protein